MERAWGGVLGRYWYRWLRGQETHSRPTRRRSIAHQHVLPPDARNEHAAWGVAVRLLYKAASRMPHLNDFAQKLSRSVGLIGQRHGALGSPDALDPKNKTWTDSRNLEGGKQDTMTILTGLQELWAKPPKGTPSFLGVTLYELLPATSVTAPLFPQRSAARKTVPTHRPT